MKPFKVWNANRCKKVIVVANSLEELTRLKIWGFTHSAMILIGIAIGRKCKQTC